ncbi:MAG: phage major capsid protein [Actinomycetia bacterium]|nr:phage major capsid protein [Actinomycetes bacterium]
MTKLERLQGEFVAIEAKAKPLHEKESRTDAEAAEFKDLLAQMKAKKAEIDLEVEATSAFSSLPGDRVEVHDVADEAPYAMGEFLQDVAFEARTHEKRPRLVRHQQRNRIMAAASGMNEGLPAEGGFMVGTDFASGMVRRVYDNSQVVNRCSKLTISGTSNSIKINGIDETSRATGSRWGGVRGYWIEEAGTLTGSKPKFRQIELLLKKQAVLYYATDEVLQDATALEQNANMVVSGEIQFLLQDAIINGNGAGKPLGILQGPCLVSVDAEPGQEADTIVFQNISKMWARCWAGSRANSIWLINQEIEPQLDLLSIPVGTGGAPVYMPPGGLADSPYGRLKGRPVVPIEQCAALGDAGDIILADLGQYQLADKGGVQMASSMHVEFLTDQMVFRFIYRVDGQPLWHSALTPYKGAGTLSPFVTLAARA